MYPYNSHIFPQHYILADNFVSKFLLIIFVINLSLRFISPLFSTRAHTQYASALCLSLSLSLYISLTSLSLFLSYLFLPLYIYPSTFLSLSLSPSLSLLYIIHFGVSNGRFRPCFLLIHSNKNDFFK